jgi:HNH endonuclease
LERVTWKATDMYDRRMRRAPQKSSVYRTARNKFIDYCEQVQAPCSWCGQKIDYTIRGRHSQAPSCDHIVELWQGGHLTDPANFTVMHYGCNTRKSIKLRPNGYTAYYYAKKWQTPKTDSSRRW